MFTKREMLRLILFKEMTDTIGPRRPLFRRASFWFSDCWVAAICRLAPGKSWRWYALKISSPREVPGGAETWVPAGTLQAYILGPTFSGNRNFTTPIATHSPGLPEQGLSYYCTCARRVFKNIGGIYDVIAGDLHHGPRQRRR